MNKKISVFSVSLCLRGLLLTLLLSSTLLGQSPDGMAQIPAGDYWMGRTRLWLMDEIGWQLRDRADDRPVHRVDLKVFLLDTHEVTNADYATLVAKKGAEAPYHWGGPKPPAGKERLPVYNVSWYDAR